MESEYRWEFAGVIHTIQPSSTLFSTNSSPSLLKHRRKFFPPPFTLPEISESIGVFNILQDGSASVKNRKAAYKNQKHICFGKCIHFIQPTSFKFLSVTTIYAAAWVISVLYQPTFQFSVILFWERTAYKNCAILGNSKVIPCLTPDFTLVTPAWRVISRPLLKKELPYTTDGIFHTRQATMYVGSKPNCLQKLWEIQDRHLSGRKVLPSSTPQPSPAPRNHLGTSVQTYFYI